MAGTNLSTVTATVLSGTSLSAAAPLNQMVVVGIVMPATWTAADLTFQVSSDGGATFHELYTSAGTPVQYQSTAAVQFGVDGRLWGGIDQVKVRSGTAGVAVNQGADRAITLLLKLLA
jgi:hypothetical protein